MGKPGKTKGAFYEENNWFSLGGRLSGAMPVMAQAAEFPAVDIATKCEYANGHTGFKKDDRPDEITMKKLILTETETDGFAAGAKFVFTADGKMQFAEKEKTVVENGSVKAECYAEEGNLIVQILAADDTKQEALTLSDYTLDAENGALEVGSGVHYGLYADYEDADGKAEQTKVIENFVDANFEISTRTNWDDNHSCGREFYLFRRRQGRVGYSGLPQQKRLYHAAPACGGKGV